MKPCARLYLSFVTLLLSGGLLLLTVGGDYGTPIVFGAALVAALSLLTLLLSLRDAYPDAPRPGMRRLLSLLAVAGPLLSVYGRLTLGEAVRGPSLVAPLLLGELPGDAETLLRLFLLMLLASFAALPPYLSAAGAVARRHFDSAGAVAADDRHLGYTERALALGVLLPFALLGIFATHLFVLFLLLGVNLYYLLRVRRAALAALATALLAAAVAFLAYPTNGLYHEVTGLAVALDLFPLLLLIPIVAVLMGAAPRSILARSLLLLLGTVAAAALSFLGLLLPEPQAPTALLIDYALPALAIVAAVGLLFAVFYTVRAFWGMHRGMWRTLYSLLSLVLVFAACLLPVSYLLRGDARALDGALLDPPGAPEIEYRLYEDSEFTSGGVRYAVSNKWLVALRVVSTQRTVTVAGYDGEAAIPEEARRYLTPANSRTVYAVASGFLDGNERIETLVFPEGTTLGFFERAAIRGCPNLKTVRLGYTPHREVTALAATAASLSLPREARLEVTDLSQLDAYATSLRPFAGRMVAARDLVLCLTLTVEAEVTGRSTSLRSVSSTVTVTGEPIAGKPFTRTFRADTLLHTEETTLLKRGEPLGRMGDIPLTVAYRTSGELRSFGSFKYLYYDFAAEGSFTADSPFALADNAHHRGEEADCRVSVAISLAYE